MWWCLTHSYQQLGGTWHFHLQGYRERTHNLKSEAAGSSKLCGSIYQTSWSHIPWLYSQQTEVLITYHMPRFNIHEHQGRRTAHWIPRKICHKFHSTKHMVMSPFWTCPAVRIYGCCVFRCHI